MKRLPSALDYAKLAQLNRPTDAAALVTEVRRLAGTGLTAIDIAAALRIDLAAVRELLAASGDEAAQIHAQAWRR